MSSAVESRLPVRANDSAAFAAGALPQEAAAPDQVAAENVRRLADAKRLDADVMTGGARVG